jgi:hypothetical protein
MPRWRVRITGTINDEVEVEAPDITTEEQARAVALEEWRYVEYEDLEAQAAERVDDDG